jgi:hypothetical protein
MAAIATTLQAVIGLRGHASLAAVETLPNDGKVDRRRAWRCLKVDSRPTLEGEGNPDDFCAGLA